MVEVKVILYGSPFMFHCCTHVAAIVTDLPTNQKFEIEYGDTDSTHVRRTSLAFASSDDCCCNIVTLYSNKSFDEFVSAYNLKYAGKHEDYSFCFNNCADAVDFALEYFFSDSSFETCLYTTMRLLCFPGCIGTLGLLSCFPTPPLMASPSDTYRKAKLLSLRYGFLNDNENLESHSSTEAINKFQSL